MRYVASLIVLWATVAQAQFTVSIPGRSVPFANTQADISAFNVTAKDVDGTSTARSVKTRFENLVTHTSGYVNVKDPPFNAKGDGVTDDTAAMSSLVTALGSTPTTIIVPGPVKVTSNITIPSTAPVRFEGNGAFTGTGTVSFTPWMAADPNVLFYAKFTTPGVQSSLYASKGEPVTVVRASSATLLSGGVETTATANQARVDEDGLIVEPGMSQLLAAPDNLLNTTYWTTSNATITGLQTAPDGSSTAFLMTDNAVNTGHWIYQLGSPTGITAMSVYAKAGTKSWLRLIDNSNTDGAYFNLATGAVGTLSGNAVAEIEPVGGGWYRCSIIITPTAGMRFAAYMTIADNTGSYLGDGTGTIYLWRPQVENNPCATSWALISRAAETAVVPIPALGPDWTIEVSLMPIGAQRWDRGTHLSLFGVGQQNIANSVELYSGTSTGVLTGLITDGTGTARSMASAAGALAGSGPRYVGPRRLALSSSGYDRPAIYYDGRAVQVAATGTGTGVFWGTGPSQTVLYLGSVLGGTPGVGINQGGFKIREIKVTASRTPPWRPQGAYAYAWAMPRGYAAPAKVLAFLGDSITQGIYDVSITTPFPQGTVSNLGTSYLAHNYGIGSNTSDMILQRWKADVRSRGYSTLVLLAGINDVDNYIPSQTTISNLDAIISDAKSLGMKVVVLTLLPCGKTAGDPMRANLDAVNAWIRARAGITVVDAYADFDDGAGKMKAAWDIDGGSLHPNQAGQTELARIVSLVLP